MPQNLLDLANYVSIDTSTINGLVGPHVIFTGANVHIRNGTGATSADFGGSNNGVGNLLLGYNETDFFNPNPLTRSGSHTLVVGPAHDYTGSAGFVAGYSNLVLADYATVSGGRSNEASAWGAHVSGGDQNKAIEGLSTISGGAINTASGLWASVSGGLRNTTIGENSSVSGGVSNTASGRFSSVSAGERNLASGQSSSVSGGGGGEGFPVNAANVASGDYSSVSGGKGNLASGESSSVSGGIQNTGGQTIRLGPASVEAGQELPLAPTTGSPAPLLQDQ